VRRKGFTDREFATISSRDRSVISLTDEPEYFAKVVNHAGDNYGYYSLVLIRLCELSSGKQLHLRQPHYRGRIRSENTIGITANPGRILQADHSDYGGCERRLVIKLVCCKFE